MAMLTPVLHGLIAFLKPVRFYPTPVIDICVFAAVRFVLRCFRALSDRSPQKESPSGNEKPKENSDCPTTSQVTDLTPEHIPWSCDERIDWFCPRNMPTPHSTINFVQGDQYNITEAPDNMVISQRQLRIRPWKSRMHRGELEGMKVVVKTYGRQDIMEFYHDVQRLRQLFHPNLHWFLGYSGSSSPAFIVVDDFSKINIHQHLKERSKTGKVDGFMATLDTMRQISSSLEYLRESGLLNKTELEYCANPSNFVQSTEGHVIIGHNLLAGKLEPQSSLSPVQLEQWLRDVFWRLAVTFVFGDGPLNYSDWKWSTARHNNVSTSHLRSLPRLACYLIPTLSDVVQVLDKLEDALSESYSKGQLTFSGIRRHLKTLESGAFIYRPNKPLPVNIGDIGFMNDGEFVVLSTVRHRLNFHYATPVPLTATCNGSFIFGESDGSGIIRHQFFNVACATIKREEKSEMVINTEVAWDFLIANASQIRESHLNSYPTLCVQDLILVTGLRYDIRCASFDWKVTGSLYPAYVEFIEYQNPCEGGPWGEWEISDGVSAYSRIPQQIAYVQLEDTEIG